MCCPKARCPRAPGNVIWCTDGGNGLPDTDWRLLVRGGGKTVFRTRIGASWCAEGGEPAFRARIEASWCAEGGEPVFRARIGVSWCAEGGEPAFRTRIGASWCADGGKPAFRTQKCVARKALIIRQINGLIPPQTGGIGYAISLIINHSRATPWRRACRSDRRSAMPGRRDAR